MQYEQESANQMVYLIAQMFYVFLFLISLGGIKTRQAATIVAHQLAIVKTIGHLQSYFGKKGSAFLGNHYPL